MAYELTRDLYEKQRVVDQYLLDHKEDDQLLNQYFSNSYFKAKLNKYRQLVYYLPYRAVDIRSNYRAMWFTTTVAATFLGLMHPALALLTTYDYYLLLRGTAVMNQTCNVIVLDRTKRHVLLSKLNFLGYERKPKTSRTSLSNIVYIGEFENTFITMDNYGLLPSVAQYLHRGRASSESSVATTGDKQLYASGKDNFRYSTSSWRTTRSFWCLGTTRTTNQSA